jgi:hypothetical protein
VAVAKVKDETNRMLSTSYCMRISHGTSAKLENTPGKMSYMSTMHFFSYLRYDSKVNPYFKRPCMI